MLDTLNMKEKKEKCKHCFYPVSYTCDTQVFGLDEEEESFLENKGFAIVECSECGERGYCILG